MIEKIAKFGIGHKPPSYHEMRVTFLAKEMNDVMAMLEEFKEVEKDWLYNYNRWFER